VVRDAAYREAERRIEAARLENATELSLFYLGLTELPESLGNLSRLKVLDLRNNQLTELSESLGNLSQLQVLSLSDNQLMVL